MPIRYFSEDVDFKLTHPRKTANWIKVVSKKEGSNVGELNYVFCSDLYLHRLNLEFLRHDTLTDIITFDYSANKVVSGDIYVSVERVKENSLKFNTAFEQELRRVVIHGLLHLLGYNDKKKAEIDVMRKREEACLSLWKTMFHVKR